MLRFVGLSLSGEVLFNCCFLFEHCSCQDLLDNIAAIGKSIPVFGTNWTLVAGSDMNDGGAGKDSDLNSREEKPSPTAPEYSS